MNSDRRMPNWSVFDTFTIPPFATVWEVQQVVERGLVVEEEGAGGHRHLVEWSELSGAHRIYTQATA